MAITIGSALWLSSCGRIGYDRLSETVDPAADSGVQGPAVAWEHIGAQGGRIAAPQSPELTAAAASVQFRWQAPATSDLIAGYEIYRAQSSGGQDFASPIATMGASTREFTDIDVTSETDYYYAVRPIIAGAPAVTRGPDSELLVSVPPPNMVLVHRWAANREMCALMGKTSDRDNHYRCAYSGPGGDGSVFDMGHSVWIDVVETGCNVTMGGCGGSDCLSLGNPSVVANEGSVSYNRSSGACFINTSAGAGSSWTDINSPGLSPAQRALAVSSAPGLPPISQISQQRAWDSCQSLSAGATGSKRLLHHKEWLAAAAWPPNFDDAAIDTIENGRNLPTTGHCNSNGGDGLVFDNLVIPNDPETVAHTNASGSYSLRTGSVATRECLSVYGAQDMVGNVFEWNAEQCSWTASVCRMPNTPLDASATDLVDWVAMPEGWEAHANLASHFLPAIGLPVASSGDGKVPSTTWGAVHGDYLYMSNTGSTRGVHAGADWLRRREAGRFAVALNEGPSDSLDRVGMRCGVSATP